MTNKSSFANLVLAVRDAAKLVLNSRISKVFLHDVLYRLTVNHNTVKDREITTVTVAHADRKFAVRIELPLGEVINPKVTKSLGQVLFVFLTDLPMNDSEIPDNSHD